MSQNKNQDKLEQLTSETFNHFKTGHLAVSICNNTKFFLIKNNGQSIEEIQTDIDKRSKFLKIRLTSVISRGL